MDPQIILDAIENAWREGRRAAELDEQDKTKTACPYAEIQIEYDWWTRSYTSTSRLFRAIRAEKLNK